MLLRATAAVLLAMAACVTVEDEPADGLPLHPDSVVADSPALDALEDRLPAEPPTWTNHRPRPGTDRLVTLEDGQVKAPIEQLLANDVDPDGGRVVFVGLGVEHGGTVDIVENYVRFTPEPDFTGTGYYDYVISDGRLQATGRVEITVVPVNDAPVAFPEHIQVTPGAPAIFQVDAVDVDGDPLSVEVLDQPAHGDLSTAGDKVSYLPAAGFIGADRVTYRVSDGTAWSEPTTIDLEVMPAP